MTVPDWSSMEASFLRLYPGAWRQRGVGVLVEEALSPGDLLASVMDEEEGCPPASVLRARGWPIPPEVEDDDPYDPPIFSQLWVLPWLGWLSLAEGEALLTIDGFERAPALVLEVESGAMFWGAPWRGGFRLQPGAWLAASLAVLEAPGSGGMGRHGRLHLGLRRLPDRLGVVVLPPGEAGRLGLRALLGVGDAALAGALSDELRGRFR